MALLLAATPACATSGIFTANEMRTVWRESLPGETAVALEVPFDASEEIVEAARRAIGDAETPDAIFAAIRHEFFQGSDPVVRYNPLASRTARETFARRDGNCVSVANLFVAMARSVGLTARFVDASRRFSNVSLRGTHVVDSGHLTAGVWTSAGFQTIDFAPMGKPLVGMRILDDREAIAHYYNNRGYELLLTDNEAGRRASRATIESFELALTVWPDFARAHNNLGIVRGRSGDQLDASRHYLEALAADPTLAAAHSNLAELALRASNPMTALEEFARARRIQPDNAYLWLSEGLVAHQIGRFASAAELLQTAVELAPDEPLAWVGLIQAVTQTGDHRRLVQLLEKYLERWPDSIWARLRLRQLREAR